MLDENSPLFQTQWEQIVQIWENYQLINNLEIQSTNIKSQAIQFLANKKQKLTRSDMRRYHAKIQKIKNSQNRFAKNAEDKLLKELQQIVNDRI